MTKKKKWAEGLFEDAFLNQKAAYLFWQELLHVNSNTE